MPVGFYGPWRGPERHWWKACSDALSSSRRRRLEVRVTRPRLGPASVTLSSTGSVNSSKSSAQDYGRRAAAGISLGPYRAGAVSRRPLGQLCADESRLGGLALPPAPCADAGEPEAEQRQGCRFGNGFWNCDVKLELIDQITGIDVIKYNLRDIRKREADELPRADDRSKQRVRGIESRHRDRVDFR